MCLLDEMEVMGYLWRREVLFLEFSWTQTESIPMGRLDGRI